MRLALSKLCWRSSRGRWLNTRSLLVSKSGFSSRFESEMRLFILCEELGVGCLLFLLSAWVEFSLFGGTFYCLEAFR